LRFQVKSRKHSNDGIHFAETVNHADDNDNDDVDNVDDVDDVDDVDLLNINRLH
jgi:hypothetical protein